MNPHVYIWIHGAFMIGILIILLIFADREFSPGRDFAEFRDQIGVVSSSMQFSKTEKGAYVSVVGLLTNRSQFEWKEVQLEARYYDKDGKLIDTGIERNYEAVMLPNSEAAFRIRTVADKPETAYANHKVFVRTAKDARRIF